MNTAEKEDRIFQELQFIRAEVSSLREQIEKRQSPKEMGETPRLLSLSDAARDLGLSVKTIRRMIDSQKIIAKNIGRRVLIPVSQLAELAANDSIHLPSRNKSKSKRPTTVKAATRVEVEKARAALRRR